jgi:hypothetical protein
MVYICINNGTKSTIIYSKINQLMSIAPKGAVLLSSWLTSHGYSFDLIKRYKHSGWLEPIGTGALMRSGDTIDIYGALYALQAQAINLFIKNMPRLSVDIDMIYTPIENITESANNINIALSNIQNNIEKILPNVKIQHLKEKGKLTISHRGSGIKLEVNLVKRGIFGEPKKTLLCEAAQTKYDAFVAMYVSH